MCYPTSASQVVSITALQHIILHGINQKIMNPHGYKKINKWEFDVK
jgi:hypothetical protein